MCFPLSVPIQVYEVRQLASVSYTTVVSLGETWMRGGVPGLSATTLSGDQIYMAMLDYARELAAVHSSLPIAEFVWLLLLASITTVVVRWVPVPRTVALVLVGLVVSAAGLLSGVHPTAAVIVLVFLPPLLFQAALEVYVHALGRALPEVVALASLCACAFWVQSVRNGLL